MFCSGPHSGYFNQINASFIILKNGTMYGRDLLLTRKDFLQFI